MALRSAPIVTCPNSGSLHYKVQGSLKWLILELPVFSEKKAYKGVMNVTNGKRVMGKPKQMVLPGIIQNDQIVVQA